MIPRFPIASLLLSEIYNGWARDSARWYAKLDSPERCAVVIKSYIKTAKSEIPPGPAEGSSPKVSRWERTRLARNPEKWIPKSIAYFELGAKSHVGGFIS